MNNTKMVDLPWVDGTTRIVPEWTVYVDRDGYLVYARDDGYSIRSGAASYPHADHSVAVSILTLTEAPEPPVKVTVPTGLGAIVSLAPPLSDDPGYVLTRKGWRGLRTYKEYDPSEIAQRLRDGARILYEGVEEGGN